MPEPSARSGAFGLAAETDGERGLHMRGVGRVAFVAVLLFLAGFINILYGFGALGGARVFVGDTRYILTNVNALGWVLIIIGVIQLTGGVSLMSGAAYGRVIGVIAASLGAIGALLSIGGRYPWWSLAVFFLCIYIVHGIMLYGQDERAVEGAEAGALGGPPRT